jgi:preprotein translocase subunit SecG
MQTVIIVIHLMVVLAMIAVVLLQKSEGGGLGIGSGGGGGFLSSRGTANVLTRTTAILAGIFFATSLLLSILAGFGRQPTSILKNTGAPVSQPGAPSVPLGKEGRGVLDAIKKGSGPATTAPTTTPPAAPQGPQVPLSK